MIPKAFLQLQCRRDKEYQGKLCSIHLGFSEGFSDPWVQTFFHVWAERRKIPTEKDSIKPQEKIKIWCMTVREARHLPRPSQFIWFTDCFFSKVSFTLPLFSLLLLVSDMSALHLQHVKHKPKKLSVMKAKTTGMSSKLTPINPAYSSLKTYCKPNYGLAKNNSIAVHQIIHRLMSPLP